MPRPSNARMPGKGPARGNVRMVDVTTKNVTQRKAKAQAIVRLSKTTLEKIQQGQVPKGDVFSVAKVAGIQAAKDTARILPLCHPIPLESVDIEFDLTQNPSQILIQTLVKASWKTGVEMEALASCMAAALTIYDMCKALERGISIHSVELLEKHGGQSGSWLKARSAT